MNNNSVSRPLALYNILSRYTDEQHPLSMKEIQKMMQESGHGCSDDSICRYIKQLQSELGLDIVSSIGRNAGYFLGDRLLEKEELKLIIDAVNASKFIGKDHSKKIISKLKDTMSVYDAEELERNIMGMASTKAENKKILYNLNVIQKAIDTNKQISFEYRYWNAKKELVKRTDRRYTVSPWTMIWANDRYYLYGYDVKAYNDVYNERNYRLDKMHNVSILQASRTGANQFLDFNADTYVSRRISMFSGEEQMVTVEINERLVGSFIDQFGKDIVIKELGDDILKVSFSAVVSEALFGWLIGLGGVKIIMPKSVRERYINFILGNVEKNK